MSGYESQNNHRTRFAANWVVGAEGASWSQRRRLMAVLRRAHRVLGVDHKDMGVGSLGFGGGVRSVLLASASPASVIGGVVGALFAVGLVTPQAAFGQTAIGNGVLTNSANCTSPAAGPQS